MVTSVGTLAFGRCGEPSTTAPASRTGCSSRPLLQRHLRAGHWSAKLPCSPQQCISCHSNPCWVSPGSRVHGLGSDRAGAGTVWDRDTEAQCLVPGEVQHTGTPSLHPRMTGDNCPSLSLLQTAATGPSSLPSTPSTGNQKSRGQRSG